MSDQEVMRSIPQEPIVDFANEDVVLRVVKAVLA
jgi:hypothetical protein